MPTHRAFKPLTAALALLLACCGPAACKNPASLDSGAVENHIYHSLWFHLSYRYPASTTSVPLQSLHLPAPNSKGALLFAAREFKSDTAYPSGVLLYVDELGHYLGQVKSGSDYIGKIERTWPRGYANRPSIPTPSGITFYRVDYRDKAGQYDAAVAGTTQGYAWVFKFNADSQAHLDSLVSSISSISPDGALR